LDFGFPISYFPFRILAWWPVICVGDGCGDPGAGCGRETRQSVSGRIVGRVEDEEETVDLTRMRAAMTAERQMGRASQSFGWGKTAFQLVESPPDGLAAREHISVPLC
jgi:hypothetical protein